jgi:hypothetical protein
MDAIFLDRAYFNQILVICRLNLVDQVFEPSKRGKL